MIAPIRQQPMRQQPLRQQQPDLWDERPVAPPETLVVELSGFEGPLDLLLELARSQKVDLARISILALAEQYLAFIEHIRTLRLELAADYLVMAAWLAYLKSRLILPDPPANDEEPSGEELAAALALRLRRLEAMRRAADRLAGRPRLGRDVFARGSPEAVVQRQSRFHATLHDLLTAYADHRRRTGVTMVQIPRREVWPLADARAAILRLLGTAADWMPLDALLPAFSSDERRRTYLASSLAASLELVRDGSMAIRQNAAFAPVLVRAAKVEAGDG